MEGTVSEQEETQIKGAPKSGSGFKRTYLHTLYTVLHQFAQVAMKREHFSGKRKQMNIKQLYLVCFVLLLLSACGIKETSAQNGENPEKESTTEAKEPHRYGGWYCPDNFGFVPVDIQDLEDVPAVSNRLPTEQELRDNKSLIKVDTEKYPDARALEMDLPRVGRVYSENSGINELVIVIQAIVVQEDTVVGYRFTHGGNGSAWLNDVSFLSDSEIKKMGSQPYFYSHKTIKASKEDIWNAFIQTKYASELGSKFKQKEFFGSSWNPESRAYLSLNAKDERATGFAGTHFGNPYVHIDYDRDGMHYSEKMLMIENKEEGTTDLFFACGPFPENFKKAQNKWEKLYSDLQRKSEGK